MDPAPAIIPAPARAIPPAPAMVVPELEAAPAPELELAPVPVLEPAIIAVPASAIQPAPAPAPAIQPVPAPAIQPASAPKPPLTCTGARQQFQDLLIELNILDDPLLIATQSFVRDPNIPETAHPAPASQDLQERNVASQDLPEGFESGWVVSPRAAERQVPSVHCPNATQSAPKRL